MLGDRFSVFPVKHSISDFLELGRVAHPVLRKRAATNAWRLINGQAQGSDIDTLYLDLAELGMLPPVLRDLRDFVAHRGKRTRGYHHKWVSAITESARFLYVQTAGLSLGPAEIIGVLKARAHVASRLPSNGSANQLIAKVQLVGKKIDGWEAGPGLMWSRKPSRREKIFTDQLLKKMNIPPLFDADELATQMIERICQNDVMDTTFGSDIYEPVKRVLALHAAATIHGVIISSEDRPDIILQVDTRSPLSVAALAELKPAHLHPIGKWGFTFHIFNTAISTSEGSSLDEPPETEKRTLMNPDWPLEFRDGIIVPMEVPPTAWVREYSELVESSGDGATQSPGSNGRSVLLSMVDKNGHFE